MRLVVVESPYAGDIAKNIDYVRACMAHAIKKGEAPYASHALYAQPGVLRDEIPGERALGITAGFAWGAKADLRAFYVDLGWSPGMVKALTKYRLEGLRYEFRVIGNPWSWLLAPLGPNGEDLKDASHKEEDYALRVLCDGGRPIGMLEHAGVSLATLTKLEAEGLVEQDEWPNGAVFWRTKQETSST